MRSVPTFQPFSIMTFSRKAAKKNKLHSKAGATLTELLIGMTISAAVLGGTISLFLMGSTTAANGIGRLLINRDIRNFTNEMIENARYADYFKTYTSFSDRTEQNDGSSGDFLILVHRDASDPDKISRVIGYYRYTLSAEAEGPVLMFDNKYSPSTSTDLGTLLPAADTKGTHGEIIELSNGLSDGKLFYNFYDRSVVVRGEIIHNGAIGEHVTNTYNFTISPRG